MNTQVCYTCDGTGSGVDGGDCDTCDGLGMIPADDVTL